MSPVKEVHGPRRGTNGLIYDVFTDLDPQTLTAVGLAIAGAWMDYAMGRLPLGGRMIKHPTGRMASAVRFRQLGVAKVQIMVNEKFAPEAGYIEEPRRAVDLKEYFRRGTHMQIHRGPKTGTSSGPTQYKWQGDGYGAPVLDTSASARRKNIWAAPRKQGNTGWASIGSAGWVIPAMPAFSPAAHLIDLLRNDQFT